MRSLFRAALVFAVAAALASPGIANAEYLPGAQLVSMSPARQEQADSSTSAVDISADGRYVAFQTRARNLFPADYQDPPGQFRQGGIFRRDMQTGNLELVALGDLLGGETTKLGAKNPSISGNGRYVSFSTADQLAAADVNTQVDVYVRDMDQPFTSPSAFQLVSACDGGDQPATYGTGVAGAQVTAESAISADGRKVVFGTSAQSDLPAAPLATTPARQLFVRDLDAHTTTLVTRNKTDGTPAGGANGRLASAISGDGSTVAWPGSNAPAQTRVQPGEPVDREYYMWRRVADGPPSPTRRITGAADVDDPACPETEEIQHLPTATGPCYGPLSDVENFLADLPAAPTLTADGTKVVFLVFPPARPFPNGGNQFDLFVTDMSAGLTRKASTTELTREIQSDVVNHISAAKISADGTQVAFVSRRRDFGLTTPRLITPPPANFDHSELYVVHLNHMEIERVTSAYDGTEIDRTVSDEFGAVSISADGSRLAFVSLATNLFRGDANSADDAFVASQASGTTSGEGTGEPPFDDLTPREDTDQTAGPALPVSVRRGKGGALRVIVKAPQRGTVSLTARARVRAGRKAPLRPIAKASKHIGKAGRVTLVLRPASRYRRYLHRTGRLRSRLEARFIPDVSGRTLVARRTVSFTS